MQRQHGTPSDARPFWMSAMQLKNRLRCLRLVRRRRIGRPWLPVLTAAFAAVLLSLAMPQATNSQTATPRYPNLKTNPPSGLRYEQMTINGVLQWVIRFDTTVWNAGTGPLHLVPVNSGGRTTVWQYVYSTNTATGEPVEKHNAGEAEFHSAHNHWHFQDFAKYELYKKSDWDGRTGQKRGEGVKTTFCIIDTTHVSGTLSARYTQCGQTSVTGLTVGWGDTYTADLADQWVVVGQSKLENGEYVLRSIADPLNKLKEGPLNGANESIDDNQAVTAFSVCSGEISLSGCTTSGGPANDNFAAAAALSVPGSASAQTQSATTETGEPNPCAPIGKTVWYRLVPGSSGTLTAATAGSGFDTVLALYRGSSLAALTSLACNDDVNYDAGDLTSRVSASVTAGQTYYIQAGGYDGAGGSLALNISMGGTTPPTATTVHVHDLDGSTARSGNKWRARVTIAIHDTNQEASVAGATVSGNWGGGSSGSTSCTTSTDGTCTVSTGWLRTTTSVNFTVTGVTGSSMTYASSSNHDKDTSSNGTTITVNSP